MVHGHVYLLETSGWSVADPLVRTFHRQNFLTLDAAKTYEQAWFTCVRRDQDLPFWYGEAGKMRPLTWRENLVMRDCLTTGDVFVSRYDGAEVSMVFRASISELRLTELVLDEREAPA